MKIDEAVKKALETESMMYRKSFYEKVPARRALIKPTNSYETCILFVQEKKGPQVSSRCWNPTADDLVADDWEVTKA